MPSGASSSLVAWFSLNINLGCHGASPTLGSFHSLFLHPSRSHPKIENFNHTKLNKTFVRSISIRKPIFTLITVATHSNFVITLYLLYSNFAMAYTPDTNHRIIKISTQCKENRICQKQNSL